MLERAHRSRLLELARRSIGDGAARASPGPPPEEDWPTALREPRASFVTLTVDAELRGCRGTLEPRRSLVTDVWLNAWASAYSDPRFGPLEESELPRLAIAISVLTPLEPIEADCESQLLKALEPGLDGLVLRLGETVATFLPSVWQTLPDPREFLAHLKLKAGWSAAFWSSELIALRYRTESFGCSGTPALAS